MAIILKIASAKPEKPGSFLLTAVARKVFAPTHPLPDALIVISLDLVSPGRRLIPGSFGVCLNPVSLNVVIIVKNESPQDGLSLFVTVTV